MTLEEELTTQNKVHWLDVGSGKRFDHGFECVDVVPIEAVPDDRRPRYHYLDIVNAGTEQLGKLGTFDLVRMQHVFEHLEFEEGHRALLNCGALLRSGGYLLISTPDLRTHINTYLSKSYDKMPVFQAWAGRRIPQGAPDSALFSVFAHSLLGEAHKWCYDFEGLAYQIDRTGMFTEIRELQPYDQLASQPFTHNRPEEDVCVLARKI